MTRSPDDDILLTDDDDAAPAADAPPWTVLVADDEPDVHAMTALILGDARYQGRGVRLLAARSAAEVRSLLSQRDDIAVVLLDVVMEDEHAGLDLVRWIRETRGNREIRIILRTGQPGRAPQRDVIVAYDINDYKAKAETSAESLFAAVVTALRAYDHIRTAERRAATGAAELAQDRERLRALLESCPVGVCAFDAAGRAVFANGRFSAMLGLPGERLNGVGFADIAAAPAAADFSALLQNMRERRPLRDVELRLRRADGSSFWALLNADVAVLDGRSVYLAWAHDIDRRKQAETKLAEARDLALAATKAKSTFLATMAHEIRTPMNGVLGMLELLEHSPLDPGQADVVATIRDSAAALLGIVNDVLDYSKIEAGRMELEQTPVSPAAVVEGVSEMLASGARAKNLRLTCYVDPAIPPVVYADPVRLRQVLFNLGGNAVKFTQEGAVMIRVDLDSQSEGWVRLAFEVSDTGIGIAPDALARLFAPYEQAEPSIARRFGGSGLGLSITRRLVELMQGRLTVDSAPGRGSSFRIVVPFGVAGAGAVDAFGRPPAPVPDLGGLRVLAAIPDVTERAVIADYLASAGTTPVSADTPERAAAACRDAAAACRAFDMIVIAEEIYAATVAAAPEVLGRRAGEPAPPTALLVDPGSEWAGRLAGGRVAGMAALTRPLRRGALLRTAAELCGRSAAVASPVPPASPATAGAGFRPRVLVADDNAVNRKVAAQQLALLGYAADLAADGAAALALFRRHMHDVVLTDLQMPETDGFALARALRRETADGSSRRPRIIAYTAAAVTGDDEGFDGALFDGRLDKPLSLERLAVYFPALDPVAPCAAGPAAPAVGPAADAGKEPAVCLRSLTVLCGDDDETIRGLLRDFLTAAHAAAATLRDAAAHGDRPGVRAAAHNLRGSSRTAGAQPLAQAALALERAVIEDADDAVLAALTVEVTAALEAVSDFVAKM